MIKFGILFEESPYQCPLCNKRIMYDDLVYVGSPKEITMCYCCLQREIIPMMKRLGGRLKGRYDEEGIPHITGEPDL